LTPSVPFRLAEDLVDVLPAKVAGESLELLGGRVGVPSDRLLLLLAELLAGLADRLGQTAQTFNGPLLLALQPRRRLLAGLIGHLADLFLGLVEDRTGFVANRVRDVGRLVRGPVDHPTAGPLGRAGCRAARWRRGPRLFPALWLSHTHVDALSSLRIGRRPTSAAFAARRFVEGPPRSWTGAEDEARCIPTVALTQLSLAGSSAYGSGLDWYGKEFARRALLRGRSQRKEAAQEC
jgi:hypothetical protein